MRGREGGRERGRGREREREGVYIPYFRICFQDLLICTNRSMSTLKMGKIHKNYYKPQIIPQQSQTPTCAATFPLPILRSFRTTNTILYSPDTSPKSIKFSTCMHVIKYRRHVLSRAFKLDNLHIQYGIANQCKWSSDMCLVDYTYSGQAILISRQIHEDINISQKLMLSRLIKRGLLTTWEGGVTALLLLEAHSAPMRMPQPRPAVRAKVN